MNKKKTNYRPARFLIKFNYLRSRKFTLNINNTKKNKHNELWNKNSKKKKNVHINFWYITFRTTSGY